MATNQWMAIAETGAEGPCRSRFVYNHVHAVHLICSLDRYIVTVDLYIGPKWVCLMIIEQVYLYTVREHD
jgi:hypothetical protein